MPVWWWTFGSVPELTAQQILHIVNNNANTDNANSNDDKKDSDTKASNATNPYPNAPPPPSGGQGQDEDAKQEQEPVVAVLPSSLSSERYQIVDVRTAGEYERGHIQGARNASYLPPWDFRKKLDALALDKSRPVICICLSAHRSIAACKLLGSLGFKAQQLQGGMQAWRKLNYPEIGSQQPSQQQQHQQQ